MLSPRCPGRGLRGPLSSLGSMYPGTAPTHLQGFLAWPHRSLPCSPAPLPWQPCCIFFLLAEVTLTSYSFCFLFKIDSQRAGTLSLFHCTPSSRLGVAQKSAPTLAADFREAEPSWTPLRTPNPCAEAARAPPRLPERTQLQLCLLSPTFFPLILTLNEKGPWDFIFPS